MYGDGDNENWIDTPRPSTIYCIVVKNYIYSAVVVLVTIKTEKREKDACLCK